MKTVSSGILLTICIWLIAAAAPLHAGVLNVRDYGAVAGDKTDNTAVFGMIGNFPLQEKATIVKCLAESGAAVISAGKAHNSLYAGFSADYIVVRNLE